MVKSKYDLAKERHGDDVFRNAGREGGKAKVLKGMAKLKQTDPKRFKKIYDNRKVKKVVDLGLK